MEIEVLSTSGSKPLFTLTGLAPSTTIKEIKDQIYRKKKALYPERQSIRLEVKGSSLKDSEPISSFGLKSGAKIFLKDLGPQIGWKTVFLAEYAGPLFVYLWFYTRPWYFYGEGAASQPISQCTKIAALCWSVHYAKRLFETVFVHRFSHSTMPMFNLFKNCSYYWLFTAYVAYHVNHPLFTPPSDTQMYVSLGLFGVSQLGNLSIHVALRNLRPPGTTVRKIPMPTSNPFTGLFNLVSCPNYTYEFGSWASFTAMTQCLPAGLFALAGLYQMTVWAIGKHKLYKKEFSNYPKGRKAILPLLI
ncbi:probable very-long-chain enoyl-CoA reductase art-1 [Cloeon dipterum]|uniref:probable very-long-chain enoyl-CoA reductase art-1 n=1 Tax=Cloeon dipterum TaxID=197152 RepID=UPI00321FD03B